jgi:hypothetical protein
MRASLNKSWGLRRVNEEVVDASRIYFRARCIGIVGPQSRPGAMLFSLLHDAPRTMVCPIVSTARQRVH